MLFIKNKVLYLTTFILLFVCLFFSGCNLLAPVLMGSLNGPYHHDAVILTPSNVVSLHGKDYCIIYDDVYIMQDDGFEVVSARSNTDSSYIGWAHEIQTDGNKLYVCGNHTQNGISVFSADYEYEETVFSGQVISFILQNNYIYYVERKQINEQQEFLLCKYDRNSSQSEVISLGLPKNEIIETDGHTIFANLQGKLYWADETENINYANGYQFINSMSTNYQVLQSLGFYYQGCVGLVTVGNNSISVSYKEKTISTALEWEAVLYPNIFVTNGKLYFATYEFIDNKNCKNDFCICHVGESIVFEYDFITEELIEKYKTNIGEYIISFNSANITYYSNGVIIKNQQAVKNVNAIKPFGEYYQNGQTPKLNTGISISVFYDEGTFISYSYFDNSKFIKDEYF